ncbi:MAG: nucleotidyltransferase family protein [Rhizobiaceae bacterium]
MITGIILAAGQSRRMGAVNKLVEPWQGKPLVCHVYEAAMASKLDEVIVVTGFEPNKIRSVLAGARLVHNPDFEAGMAGSISVGAEFAEQGDGVMILLGDMPLVTATHINEILSRFDGGAASIVAATSEGKLGNPVLFGRNYFEALQSLEGDRGARGLIEVTRNLTKVEIGDAGARDFDTQEAFEGGGINCG